MGTIINFDRRSPETAVERLNRQTGLDFSEWPESLLGDADTRPREHPGARVHDFGRVAQELRRG